MNPGDTPFTAISRNRNRFAQRRPGREPRRHMSLRTGMSQVTTSLNEGRGVNPGDTPSTRRRHRPASRPLNEGRGVNPGDTLPKGIVYAPHMDAQRRPGREPRRHFRHQNRNPTPTTDAQRRPGREPRRHFSGTSASSSTRTSLNEGRGVNPGDTRRRRRREGAVTALNEGRGVNPGDTRTVTPACPASHCAQRRPGREPRRHHLRGHRRALHEGRSTKAGA